MARTDRDVILLGWGATLHYSRTVVENRVEVDFREQCWGISAAYIHRTNEDEFRVTVNLLELGQYGFGRAFATFQ